MPFPLEIEEFVEKMVSYTLSYNYKTLADRLAFHFHS